MNNTTARVDMTEKRYFPGEYEDIDSESTENVRVYVTNPQPTLDDERDLGIKFTIKPEIQPGDLIRAAVKFDIKQFDSWLIVDSRNLANEDDDGEYQKKAVINTRAITTDVVLKDGATVLIGSISQDLTTSLHDRIPILADIPLIGRLFQAQSEKAERRNMLVFVTARRLGTDGAPVVSHNQGAPDFNR
jgi:general secretion pathway protein D